MLDITWETIEKIEKIYDYSDLNVLMDQIIKQREKITERDWKRVYYTKCQDVFLSLKEIIQEICKKNYCFNREDELTEHILRNKYGGVRYINDLMNYFKDNHFIITPKIQSMVCTACACENCPYLKEHLGYDCEECKKDYLTGYQGYCDE